MSSQARKLQTRDSLLKEADGGEIAGAVRAIESTQDSDGLTWAKPSWHVKYLMDQAETYAGLVAAANIGDTLRMPKLAAHARGDARRLRAGVAKLWNPRVDAYDWAVHGDGVHAVTNWSVLYPDAMQQAWAVAFGDSKRELLTVADRRFGPAG